MQAPKTILARAGSRRRLSAAQAGFGLFSLGLHLALLLVPLSSLQPPPALPGPVVLEVSLTTIPLPSDTTADGDLSGPPAASPPEALDAQAPVPLLTEPALADPAPQALHSAALLLDQVSRRPTAPITKENGEVPRGGAWPAHWNRPSLPQVHTAFSVYFSPPEVEIMDQWQEPGGVRRVVLRTPGGETLCGRAEPRSPVNPLYEPVMLFHRCAGGGQRTP